MKFINLKVFILSFSIGVLLVYLQSPKKQVIYVYPHLDNLNTIQYRDKSNTCFNLDATQSDCNKKDKNMFEDYKIQL
jgi:hypothetical protein